MPLDDSLHILDLAMSPHFDIDGACFAATDGGLFKSEDHGAMWTSALPEIPGVGPVVATAVAVSPTYPDDGLVLAAIPGGVGRSSDGGRTWQFGRLPMPAPVVSSIVLSPQFAQESVAFVGTVQDGVFRSDDGGKSWAPWNSGLLATSVVALAISPNFHEDQTLFVGTSAGVFRSENGGRCWTTADIEQDAWPKISSLGMVPDELGGYIVIAGSEKGELWSSSNIGRTWRQILEVQSGGSVRAIVSTSDDQSWSALVVLGDEKLVCSIDAGKSWRVVDPLVLSVDNIRAIALASDDSRLVAVTVDGNLVRIDFRGQTG